MIRLCEIITAPTIGNSGSAISTTVTPDLNGVIEKIVIQNPDEAIFRFMITNAASEILLSTDIVETQLPVFSPMVYTHDYLGNIIADVYNQAVVAGPLTVSISNTNPDVALSIFSYVNQTPGYY